jgi:4-amino-4-deoxy-L-arabinose transferase-like glycosyltransferase
VEISYRTLRIVFPKREDLQVIGTLIGGLLPMNLYLSQAVGNEPLAGCLSATVLVLALKLNRSRPGALPKWHLPILGFVLGLALLAKVTAVLLVPPPIFLLAYVHSAGDRPARRIALTVAVALGVALVVSGWYYLRNWIQLGKPFIGGWEPSHYIGWWPSINMFFGGCYGK